uniref:Uncharacterized protein n=1 Tax=Globodera rostochiensis TaxID=31243 RepID=A0A914IBD3_GLORO
MKEKREFIARMDEIKMSQHGEQNKLAKDLAISRNTFCCWKKEFGLPVNSKILYSESEKLELMKKYYKIKQGNLKIITLYKWKKQFDPILNKNSVDEHSLSENRATLADKDISEHPMPSSDDNLWAWNLANKKRTEKIEVNTP